MAPVTNKRQANEVQSELGVGRRWPPGIPYVGMTVAFVAYLGLAKKSVSRRHLVVYHCGSGWRCHDGRVHKRFVKQRYVRNIFRRCAFKGEEAFKCDSISTNPVEQNEILHAELNYSLVGIESSTCF